MHESLHKKLSNILENKYYLFWHERNLFNLKLCLDQKSFSPYLTEWFKRPVHYSDHDPTNYDTYKCVELRLVTTFNLNMWCSENSRWSYSSSICNLLLTIINPHCSWLYERIQHIANYLAQCQRIPTSWHNFIDPWWEGNWEIFNKVEGLANKFSVGKNRAVRCKFILGVKHPLYVHNIPLSTMSKWNLAFYIIFISLIVASVLHMVFVIDIYGQFFMHIFPKDLEVCLKLQELASPAWRLAWARPKVYDESFHVQWYFSEWWALSWRENLLIDITMQEYETWGGRGRSLAIFFLLLFAFPWL